MIWALDLDIVDKEVDTSLELSSLFMAKGKQGKGNRSNRSNSSTKDLPEKIRIVSV